MKKIIVIGAGGHAAELRDYINHYNAHKGEDILSVLGFIDDKEENYTHYDFKESFLGGIAEHKVQKDSYYLMGIANIKYRAPIISKFKGQGAHFLSLIHPLALVSPSAEIGEGTVISHHASVGPKAKMGTFNMLNSRCTIGHDTQIGDFNFIAPQVALSGHTLVGDNNLLGVNSCTIPNISIGDNNTIAAGMVLDKSVGDNETVFFRKKEKVIVRREKS